MCPKKDQSYTAKVRKKKKKNKEKTLAAPSSRKGKESRRNPNCDARDDGSKNIGQLISNRVTKPLSRALGGKMIFRETYFSHAMYTDTFTHVHFRISRLP